MSISISSLNKLKDLRSIMYNFEANSVLRFIFETKKSEKLALLDNLCKKLKITSKLQCTLQIPIVVTV